MSAGRMMDAIDRAVQPGLWWPDRCIVSPDQAQRLIDNGEDLLDAIGAALSAARKRGDLITAMRLTDAGEELDEYLDYLDQACWDEDGTPYQTATPRASPIKWLFDTGPRSRRSDMIDSARVEARIRMSMPEKSQRKKIIPTFYIELGPEFVDDPV